MKKLLALSMLFFFLGIFPFLIIQTVLSAFYQHTILSSQTIATSADFNIDIFRSVILNQCHAFSNKADKIIEEAKKAGVSPVLFAAIMAHESAWGTSAAIKKHNNPSGQMRGNEIIHFDTLDQGIEATGATLHNLVVERQLTTVESLGSVYCPVGASNDPYGLNQYWVPTIKKFLVTFGGSEQMSLLWQDSNTISVSSGKWSWPFPSVGRGQFSSEQLFGHSNSRIGGFHDGLDFGSIDHPGREVHAVHDGTVIYCGNPNILALGQLVIVIHTGEYAIVYQEFATSSDLAKVKVGDRVTSGQVIGIRNTNHLHLGITRKDWLPAQSSAFINDGTWLDPLKLLEEGTKK